MFFRNSANLLKYSLCLLLLAGMFALSTHSDVSAQESSILPQGDIVFVFDESGSFYDDHVIVKDHLNLIVTLLEDIIDYQFGLVGFGSYRGHGGTEYAGQPVIHQTLTPNMMEFSESLKKLIRVGKSEYGFNAIQLAASDRLGYRAGAASCIILITDEDADLSEEEPVTQSDAITALRLAEAFFMGVVDFDEGETLSQYGPLAGSIAHQTGGKVYAISEFREDPVIVLREIISSCINRVQEVADNGNQVEQPEMTPPDDGNDGGGGGGLFGGNNNVDLTPIVTQLVDRQATLFTRLRLLEEKVAALGDGDLTINIPVNIEEQFTNIDLTLARYAVLFENIDANFTQIDARFAALENNLTSVHASIAELRESNLLMAQRLQDAEARLSALEQNTDLSSLLLWRDEAQARLDEQHASLEEIFAHLADVRAEIEALNSAHTGFSDEIAALHGRLSETEARLTELSATLNARITELTAQLNEFDIRFNSLDLSGNVDIDMINAQFSDVMNEINSLTARVETNESTLAQLQAMADRWNQEIASLHEHVSNLSAQVEELNGLSDQVAALHGRVDELEGRVDQNSATSADLQNEMADMQSQIEDLLAQLDANAFALQADLDSIASSLGSRIQSLLNRIQSLEAAGTVPDQATLDQLEDLANLISQLQFRMAELTSKQNGQYEELTSRIDLNEEWIMMIEAWLGLGDNKDGQTNIDARMTAIEGALSDLSAQFRENERALSDFQASIDELNMRLSELEARPIGGESTVVDPARLRAAQRLAELAFLTAVASIGISLLFFLSQN